MCRWADLVLCPLEPDFLGLSGVARLHERFTQHKIAHDKLRFLLCRFSGRLNLHRDVHSRLSARFGAPQLLECNDQQFYPDFGIGRLWALCPRSRPPTAPARPNTAPLPAHWRNPRPITAKGASHDSQKTHCARKPRAKPSGSALGADPLDRIAVSDPSPRPKTELAEGINTVTNTASTAKNWDEMGTHDALNVLSNPIMIADPDMIIRFVNEAGYKMFEAIENDIRQDLPSFVPRKVVGRKH